MHNDDEAAKWVTAKLHPCTSVTSVEQSVHPVRRLERDAKEIKERWTQPGQAEEDTKLLLDKVRKYFPVDELKHKFSEKK